MPGFTSLCTLAEDTLYLMLQRYIVSHAPKIHCASCSKDTLYLLFQRDIVPYAPKIHCTSCAEDTLYLMHMPQTHTIYAYKHLHTFHTTHTQRPYTYTNHTHHKYTYTTHTYQYTHLHIYPVFIYSHTYTHIHAYIHCQVHLKKLYGLWPHFPPLTSSLTVNCMENNISASSSS